MKDHNEKIKKFKEGFIKTVKRDDVILMSALTGLYQGLKYNGSFMNGVRGAASIFLVFGCYGGIKEIKDNE